MRVLVTGGAGYIGSHAVAALIEKKHEVCVIDNLSSGFVAAVDRRATFLQGDIRDVRFVEDILKNYAIDAVLHFAASSLVGESMKDPAKYYENNVHGTTCLLQAMRDSGVNRIVFSSTAAVYGEPEETPLLEQHRTSPVNPYGETKLAMEKMMHWMGEAHGIRYVSLRYFNVGGAHTSGSIGEAHNPETHLIPLILKVALGQTPAITVFGDDYSTVDGTCVRDYIHIEDLVDAHVLALERLMSGGQGGIFNLGSGKGYTVLQMIEAARSVTGHPIPTTVASRRSGDPAVLVASPQKAVDELGWRPKRNSIEEIIASAWNFHRQNPLGYRSEG